MDPLDFERLPVHFPLINLHSGVYLPYKSTCTSVSKGTWEKNETVKGLSLNNDRGIKIRGGVGPRAPSLDPSLVLETFGFEDEDEIRNKVFFRASRHPGKPHFTVSFLCHRKSLHGYFY